MLDLVGTPEDRFYGVAAPNYVLGFEKKPIKYSFWLLLDGLMNPFVS